MLPALFRIGDFIIPTYGLLVTLGFLLGIFVSRHLGRRAGLDGDSILNLAIYSGLAGIVGAKLLLILTDIDYYSRNPGEIFSLTTLQAGGVFYGGLLGALAVAIFYVRRMKMPGLQLADALAPGVALGHAIGRIGCFAAGCCWGEESHAAWAVTFTDPEAHRLFGTPLHVPLHPTQLYEAFAEAAIFLILYYRFLKPHVPGSIIGLYLVLYSVARFLIEFVRANDPANPPFGPFVLSQWIAIGLVAVGAWLLSRKGALVKAAPVA